jgi:hypothetical protein
LRLASRTYRNLIDGSIRLGMRCAAEHRNPDLDGPSKPRRITAAEASTWMDANGNRHVVVDLDPKYSELERLKRHLA